MRKEESEKLADRHNSIWKDRIFCPIINGMCRSDCISFKQSESYYDDDSALWEVSHASCNNLWLNPVGKTSLNFL